MTRIKLNRRRFNILDGEQCFRLYWTEMGSARSIAKVALHLSNLGIYNKDTGRRVGNMAVWFSMWRWAIEHQEEAYKIFNAARRDEGEFNTQDEWKELLEDRMMTIAKQNRKKVEKWQNRILNGKMTSAS